MLLNPLRPVIILSLFLGISNLIKAQSSITVTQAASGYCASWGDLSTAIDFVNTHPGTDTIKFNIPGPGPHYFTCGGCIISGCDPIPTPYVITRNGIVIDGTSQPGWYPGCIAICGGGECIFDIDYGIKINANNVTIKGIGVNNYYGTALLQQGILSSGVNTKIENCRIDTDIEPSIQVNSGSTQIKTTTYAGCFGISNPSAPKPTINNFTTNFVAGTGPTNSVIEIYSTSCVFWPYNAAGHTYLGTVNCGPSGTWQFNHSFNIGDNVACTATKNNNTSEFVLATLNACTHPDKAALKTLYEDTDGGNWTNTWDTTSCDVCNWYGISCNGSSRVTQIDLPNNNLTGTLPNFSIPFLQRLYLSSNQLSGNIPNFNLPNLQYLWLYSNDFSGSIPTLNLSPNLVSIDLSINQLTGTIPNFSMSNLINLRLGNNQLSGSIPFFSSPNLQYLEFSNNQLSGNIPNFNYNNLGTIRFLGNQLSGAIPNFNLPNLHTLELEYNQLSGSLPNLNTPSLTNIYFNNNNLSGCFPPSYNNFCGSNYNFNNNPLLPWEGDFSQFCSGGTQIGATCDNSVTSGADVIQSDCSCNLACATFSAAPSGTTTICNGNATDITFNFSSGTPPYDVTWTGGTINGIFSGHTESVSPSSTTTYSIISATDANGCDATPSGSAMVTVTSTLSVGAVSGPVAVCQGTTNSYSVSTVAGATSYDWTVPSGATITSTPPYSSSITVNWPSGAVSGDVCCAANNTCGPGNAQCRAVTFTSIPAAPAVIYGPGQVCLNTIQNFSIDPVPDAASYTWTVPSGATITSGQGTTNITVNFSASAQSGNICVRSVAAASCGQSAQTCLPFTISPAFTSSISGTATICNGNATDIIFNFSGGTSPYDVNWTGGTLSNIVNGHSESVSPTSTTTYSISSISDANGCSGTPGSSVTVTVLNLLNVGNVTGSATVCQGATQSYSVPVVAGATEYDWSVPAGAVITSVAPYSNTINVNWPAGSSSGDVCCSAVNPCGAGSPMCRAVNFVAIPVAPGPIDGPTEVCRSTSQTFFIDPVPDAVSYTWTVPTGATVTSGQGSESIVVNFGPSAQSGNVCVRSVAASSCGQSAQTCLPITTVAQPVQPVFTAGANTMPCEGATANYSVTPQASVDDYQWDTQGYGDVISGQGTPSVTILWTLSGTTTLSVTASSSICGNAVTKNLSITVRPLPEAAANVTGDEVTCTGATVLYTADPVPGATSYTWEIPAIAQAIGNTTGNSLNLQWNSTGITTFSVRANNTCGVSEPYLITVVVNNAPAQPGSITGPTSVCAGSQAVFSIAAVADASSYNWTVPAGATIVGGQGTTTITANFTTGSSGQVCVAAVNNCGNSQVRCTNVSVGTGSALTAGAISGPAAFCPSQNTGYSISAVAGASGYQWTIPAGAAIISGQNTTAIAVQWNGITGGQICVSAVGSCGAGTPSCISVAPLAGTVFDLGADTTLCPGSPLTLSAGTGATGYLWNTSATTSSINISLSGTYTVTVTAVSGNTCTIADNITVTFGATVPPPAVTALQQPATTTNVPVSTPITWQPAAGCTGGYFISVGTTPGGTDIINNFNNGSSNTWQPGSDLPPGTTIYVTITPFNNAGNGPAGQFSFTTQANNNPGILVSDSTVAVGSIFPLDVYVENFENIAGFQFTVQWDTSKLTYNDIELAYIQSNTNFNTSNVAEGNLAVAYTAGTPAGETLPDGTVLFRVVFLAKGNLGDSTIVDIGSNLTTLYIFDNNFNTLPVSIKSGLVIIANPSCTTITTTADSGPGSFREAIICANNNPGPDTIRFALPGPGPFTFSPVAHYPFIDSNIVIDATTQPGWMPGKIVFDGSNYIPGDQPFKFKTHSGFEMYGCVVKNFPNAVFDLVLSNNIRIGRPGKGNCFYSNNRLVSGGTDCIVTQCTNVIFQSNRFGITENFSAAPMQNHGQIGIEASNVLIGGSSIAGEGNFFGNSDEGIYLWDDPFNTFHPNNIRIFGNNIGTDAGATADWGEVNGIRIQDSIIGIRIGDTTSDHRNIIGFNTEGVHIGLSNSSSRVLIGRNVFLCNDVGINWQFQPPVNVPVIQFASPQMINGTSTAGSQVDVYRSVPCGNTACQGRDYLGTATADGGGVWVLNAPFDSTITGGALITAIATLGENASEFAGCVVTEPPVNCNIVLGCPASVVLNSVCPEATVSNFINSVTVEVSCGPGVIITQTKLGVMLGETAVINYEPTPSISAPDPTDGSEFYISFSASDGLNTTIQPCSTKVILDDNTAPVPDSTTLADILLHCSNLTIFAPTAKTNDCLMPPATIYGVPGGIMTTPNETLPGNPAVVTSYHVPYTPGVYFITWSFNDGNGNISTQLQKITIVSNSNLNVQITGPGNLCSGTATLQTGSFAQYLWSDNSTTASVAVNQTGTYTVTVTDLNGCTASSTHTVSGSFPAPVPAISISNVLCSASATLSTGPYTAYIWSNNTTGQEISVNQSGNYAVTVTDGNGCTGTAGFNYTQAPPLSINATASGPVSCITPDGSIDIEILSGTAPFTYSWSNGSTTQDLISQGGGIYMVTVTDAANCTFISTSTLSALGSPVVTPAATGATCQQNNGNITLDVSGINGTPVFIWSNGATTSGVMNLSPGIYTATVTAPNMCTSVISSEIVANGPPAPQPVIAGEHIICGDSTVLMTGPFTGYLWSNNATTSFLTVNNVGIYTVTVTDANGCTGSSTHNVSAIATPPQPEITGPTALCSGAATLQLDATFFSYAWSDNTTNSSITITQSGFYTVTVTDTNGCTGTDSRFIGTGASAPTPNITIADQACTVSATLNAGTYQSYIWATGETDAALIVTASGFYSVTVTDLNGCTGTAGSNYTQAPPLSINAAASDPVSCITPDGNIDIAILSGTTPFSYLWSNGATTQDLVNQGSGIYTVTVTDAANCTFVSTSTLSAPGSPVVTPAATGATCQQNNGSITLDVSGINGTPVFLWSNGATTSGITNLSPGIYTATVTAPNMCTSVVSSEIVATGPPAPQPVIAGVHIICGDSTVLMTGPFATYLWSNNATTNFLTVNSIGNYTVTVTDANGCTGTTIHEITDKKPLPFPEITGGSIICSNPLTLTLSQNYPDILWAGGQTSQSLLVSVPGIYAVTVTDPAGCTGIAAVTVADGTSQTLSVDPGGAVSICAGDTISLSSAAVPGYSYQWALDNVDIPGAVSSVYEASVQGEYVLTGSFNGCVITSQPTQITVTALPVVTISAAGSTQFCEGGVVVLNAPLNNSLQYQWQKDGATINGAVSAGYTANTTGLYQLVVAAAGCEGISNEIVIDVLPKPAITVDTIKPAFCGEDNGAIELFVSNASGNVTYDWDNGAETKDLKNVAPGDYQITVTGGNACTSTATLTIPDIPVTQPVIVGPDEVVPGERIILNTDQVYPAYAWSTGAVSPTVEVQVAGNYTVTVTDTNGCTASAEKTITSDLDHFLDGAEDIIPRAFTPVSSPGQNDDFDPVKALENAGRPVYLASKISMIVFVRNQEVLLHFDPYPDGGWHHTLVDDTVPEGAYYYILEFVFPDGKKVRYKAAVNLVR